MASTRPPPVWIAELRVIVVHPDGRRVPGHIAVGRPYTLAGGDPAANYETHCPIEISDIHPARHPVISGGTLGALVSGVQFLGWLLHDFVARGGRVLDPEDESDVPLEAIFGPLLSGSITPDHAG